MSRARKCGSWIRARRRWSLYLRDGLRCVYCMRSLDDVLADGGFMTLDHVDPTGSNDSSNLVSACFECNNAKSTSSIASFARDLDLKPTTLRARLFKARHRDAARFVEAAGLLLGMIDGVPRAAIVASNDWLARYQFREDDPEFEYLRDLAQADLFCDACGRAHDVEPDEPLPF